MHLTSWARAPSNGGQQKVDIGLGHGLPSEDDGGVTPMRKVYLFVMCNEVGPHSIPMQSILREIRPG